MQEAKEDVAQNTNIENVFNSTTDQLLREVHRDYTATGKLSDDLLSALNFVFQAPLLPALDLVDNRNVTLVSCPSGRKVYQVVGSSGTPYTCFASSFYCSCPAYRFSVLQKDDHKMCKHTLAVKLSEAMGLCKSMEVSDGEMSNIIAGPKCVPGQGHSTRRFHSLHGLVMTFYRNVAQEPRMCYDLDPRLWSQCMYMEVENLKTITFH